MSKKIGSLAASAAVVLVVYAVGLGDHLFEIMLLLVAADWYWKKRSRVL